MKYFFFTILQLQLADSNLNSFALCLFLILVQKLLIPLNYLNGGWWGGGWQQLASVLFVLVFISIFSDEIQTKWNLTIIVFDLFKEKMELLEPSGKV